MGRIVVLTIVLILLLIKKSYSITHKGNDSLNVLVSGKVTFKSKDHDNIYRVELIKNNKVIDSLEVKEGRSFKFKLQKNEYYGIRITKNGFISRLVSVCTDIIGSESNTSHHFHFNTELLSLEGINKMNKDALDFPIAVISFNSKKGMFGYNKKYTSDIKRKMNSKSGTQQV